jgi:type 1 glutamine amidotransferase
MRTNRCLLGLAAWLLIASVAPAAPMKALIVDGQNNHNWKATTPLLKTILEETGLFSVDVATTPPEKHDMSGFHPDFAAYRVVVSNYNGDEWPEATKQAFERYMAEGGGLVLFHAADNSFPHWKAFNEMAGIGGWNGRNENDGPYVYWKEGQIVRDTSPGVAGEHGAQRPILLTVRDKEHPITKGLPEQFLHVPDELYGKLRGPAKNLTVLATAFSNSGTGGTDREEPILMTISYGKGRIFHNVLGHSAHQLHCAALIALLQRGAEWAATGNVTQPVPADFPGPDRLSVRPIPGGTSLSPGEGRGSAAPDPWVVYQGGDGPGKGKHVVLVSGDDEYRSEEMLPQLGKILAKRHGFKCTVLFAVDPATGTIDPKLHTNIPGLEALRTADLMLLFIRFRSLPDDQMRHIVDYVDAGKPILGIRTATHSFDFEPGDPFAEYAWNHKGGKWDGGFGRHILGETWIDHHGHHGYESTRGVIAPGAENDPIVRGCGDIWTPTDVYRVRWPLPGDSRPLVLGEVLTNMRPTDKPVAGPKNHPFMPIAWKKTYQGTEGHVGRVFTTTMGSAMDFQSEGLRRLLVNAVYWCVGLEAKIPARANVDYVGPYQPSGFSIFGTFRPGVRPADHAMEK